MRCTKRIQRILNSGQKLPVHSVYRHTVNLKADDGLVSLHPDFIESTPLSVPLAMCESEFENLAFYAQNQTSFWVEGGYLTSDNGFRWKTEEIRTWDAKIDVKINQEQQQRLAKKIEEFLLPLGDGGISNAAVSSVGKEDSLITAVLRKQVQEILQAPSDDRILAVMPLIGMGVGLTPSGDDFIVGLLLAYHTAWQETCKKERKALIDMVLQNASRTNDVSRQYLVCACAGEFGIKLHRLLNESDDEINIDKNLKCIKQTGHSSGIDTLNGISVGLTLLQNTFSEDSFN